MALLIVCCILYPALAWAVARAAPGHGAGVQIVYKGRVVGFANTGQKLDRTEYFTSRPSAVDYHANGSGGSNKGPSNPEYLATVRTRVSEFLRQNPTHQGPVPAELVTASRSGLDPHLSSAGAYAQVGRIARLRRLPEARVRALVAAYVHEPLVVFFGPSTSNVLELSLALDSLGH